MTASRSPVLPFFRPLFHVFPFPFFPFPFPRSFNLPHSEPIISLEPRLQAALGDTYRVLKELGGGGMSRVFLAEETRLGRQVVIKVLPPDMGASVNVERFEREIQLAARLQHPHIVPLLAAAASGD